MSKATDSPANQTRAESIPGIERATGRDWADWVRIFEAADAKSKPHSEIAIIARAEVPETLYNPDWWAQAVAIAYEQHAGLRVPGQSSSGTFRVSASRTLPLIVTPRLRRGPPQQGSPNTSDTQRASRGDPALRSARSGGWILRERAASKHRQPRRMIPA
ncbi:hypothetical protein [Leucobacter coleopterorum]|uniref:hypothetical protein n=1 Tax=Leucobacter coleopterorum TaxID=2714933 RepID=UPI001FCB3E8A|nr:hypothetical protein [Leucobacter coleopterorum]